MPMRSSARRCVSFVTTVALILASLGTTGSARAQPPAPAAGTPEDLAETCFGAAERAQPLLHQKKLREARAVLEVCARDACPKVARTDCREWLAEAMDAQPSIVIAGHEDAVEGRDGRDVRDVQGIRVVIDDALFVDKVDATPIVVDPGHHRLRLERAGADTLMQDIDVKEGEKARVIDVYWHLAAAARPSRPVPPSVFVMGGAGVAALVVGISFEAAGLSQRGSLNSSCRPTSTCTQAQVDSARGLLRVGDVALGAGVLLMVGSAILYFTRPAVNGTEPHGEGHSSAWIDVTPGGFVAGARGTL
jgi:hypothetical protein